MSARRQVAQRPGREAGLQEHRPAVDHALAGRLGVSFDAKARRVAGLLQVHPEVDHVHEDLHVALRLHVSAHDTEAHERRAVLGDEGGNDGVEGTLARRIRVGPALGQVEQLAAVLQHEAQPRRDHARPHSAIVALNERDHGAVGVGNRQVHGVAGAGRPPSRVLGGAFGIDECPSRSHRASRSRSRSVPARTRVGDIARRVFERELDHLHDVMDAVGTEFDLRSRSPRILRISRVAMPCELGGAPTCRSRDSWSKPGRPIRSGARPSPRA